MNFDNEKAAGLLLFFSTLQFIFVQLILALVEPGYSFSTEFISELGAPGASNALIFNLSLTSMGLCILITGLLLYRAYATESIFPSRLFAILMILWGIFGTAMGLVPMHAYPPWHSIFGYFYSFIHILAIFVSFKIMKPPLSYIQIVLGVMAVVTTFLFLTATDLGLGWGGIERVDFLVAYVWYFVMSTYLMNKS
ncbi:MAG: DUF998 domain-containing protein [Promethearchaeota archaeon]